MSGEQRPEGWINCCLADVVLPVGTLDPAKQAEQLFTYFDIGGIDNVAGVVRSTKSVTGADAPSRARIAVRSGDILFSTVRPGLRAVALVPPVADAPVASTGFCVLRAAEGVQPNFLYHLCRSERFVQQVLLHQRGVSYPAVRDADVLGQSIDLPPVDEQVRIVAKLDELLSELDAGVAELNAAQAKLQRYRQSLLKAAVQGDLTSNWRASHPPTESGVDLLQRILAERRARWEEAQRAKAAAQGKPLPKGWQAKYPEPLQIDTSALPALPPCWIWTSLDALIANGPQNGLYLPKSLYGQGTPILRIDDYQIGWHRPREALQLVQAEPELLQTYGLKAGDLLVNRVNSMTHLGKCLWVPPALAGALFESNMMRMALSPLASGAFVARYLGSEVGRARLVVTAKWAVNQASINQQDVGSTPVPLPPLAEQARITELLSDQLAAADAQQAAITRGLAQANAQRQNILRAAFAGQLVPQDPADEPAAALLARIRAARSEAPTNSLKRRSQQQHGRSRQSS